MNRQTTIGVVTALPDSELPAILRAFGLPVDKEPDYTGGSGQRFWFTQTATNNGETSRVVITCIGRSGNPDSTLRTNVLIERYAPEFMVLVGIACGYRKYSLGDVVTADVVWAYEYLKTTKTGPLDRSRAQVTQRHIRDDVEFLSVQKMAKWLEVFNQCKREIDSKLLPRKENIPVLHRSVWIASGEKVLANGELERLNKRMDLVRAGEMEGYGFAEACEQHRPPIPWLIVRGISDYGDETKDGNTRIKGQDKTVHLQRSPRKDEYHQIAAQAAAAFVRMFLQYGYTRPSSDNLKEELITLEPLPQQSGPLAPRAQRPTDKEGIRAVYTSDYDPQFTTEMLRRIRSAKSQIVMVGMGLSFLKGNTEMISAIASRLQERPSLTVEIYYGNPKNKGIKNRVEEEHLYSAKSNRSYNRAWPTEHLDSILKAFQNEVHPRDYERFSIKYADCLPMITIVQIDEVFFWYPYGSPNIRGKESPWMLVENRNSQGAICQFLENNIKYFLQLKSPTLLSKVEQSG